MNRHLIRLPDEKKSSIKYVSLNAMYKQGLSRSVSFPKRLPRNENV